MDPRRTHGGNKWVSTDELNDFASGVQQRLEDTQLDMRPEDESIESPCGEGPEALLRWWRLGNTSPDEAFYRPTVRRMTEREVRWGSG